MDSLSTEVLVVLLGGMLVCLAALFFGVLAQFKPARYRRAFHIGMGVGFVWILLALIAILLAGLFFPEGLR